MVGPAAGAADDHRAGRPARPGGRNGDRRGHHGRRPRGGRLRVSAHGESLTVTVPPWRPDLTDPFDLVEEVVRVVGYDRVPSVLPPAPRAAASPSSSRCVAGWAARSPGPASWRC